MVVRTWHGWTSKENADRYEQLLRSEVAHEIESKVPAGFQGIELCRKEEEDEVAFMTIMRFDSIESIKALTGEEVERAYVPAAAQAVLKRYDTTVTHYEVTFSR